MHGSLAGRTRELVGVQEVAAGRSLFGARSAQPYRQSARPESGGPRNTEIGGRAASGVGDEPPEPMMSINSVTAADDPMVDQ